MLFKYSQISYSKYKTGKLDILLVINEEDLIQSKAAVINSLPDYFESNEQTASTFLYLKRQNLEKDFFVKRAEIINKITLLEVKQAVKRLVVKNPLLVVKVGRV